MGTAGAKHLCSISPCTRQSKRGAICIYIRQRRPEEVLRRFRKLRPGEAVVSVITYGELQYGAAKSEHRASALERLSELVNLLPALLLPETAGETFGAIRAQLESKGEMIGNKRSLDRRARPSDRNGACLFGTESFYRINRRGAAVVYCLVARQAGWKSPEPLDKRILMWSAFSRVSNITKALANPPP
jgi:predicted nucleic acid-binding protein